MNYLAHLFLAQPTTPSRVGNLLGDFAKGVDTASLPPEVYRGLQNHRQVDLFTDQHPQVMALKPLFSQKRRRFAGIALDLAFDHFLIKHWEQFCAEPFPVMCQRYYASLLAGQNLMPASMQHTTQRIVAQDWFSSYATLEGVGYALDRIAGRIRFDHQFAGVYEELSARETEIEAAFLIFFPQLQQHVTTKRVE